MLFETLFDRQENEMTIIEKFNIFWLLMEKRFLFIQSDSGYVILQDNEKLTFVVFITVIK
jgi:hypothetical protein